ncbi:MarR family transcriptional regulator [Methylobacterium sp. WL64]|uniref:MarR family winged helix-turn-helix transcriptional regulator n=1 Tax=Methylobacterium sp. WL64 TaxID=2603894 RepID=UPI0011CC2FB0|nr:MarR family transcriptional regulator [Methylobacterium sp. WL64]TXN00172.1 MarR family transcriptional regulator [Methylobacterium sp. WL64]
MPLLDLFTDSQLKVPDDSLGFLLWRVTHAWQRFVDDQLEVCGLTHLQFALMIALGWLTRHDEPTTQSDLVAFVEMHPMQVSQVLSILQRKELVSRDRNPANGRTKRIALTGSGETTLRQALPLIEGAHTTFFGPRGAVADDLRTILQSLVVQHSK